MVATKTSMSVLDSAQIPRSVRTLDESGNGSGPHVLVHALDDGTGSLVSKSNPMPTQNSASDPARKASVLQYSEISNTADLSLPATAIRVFNGTANPVTLSVIPADQTDPVPLTVPPGLSLEPIVIKRIRVAGSTNLITGGAITPNVEVVLFH